MNNPPPPHKLWHSVSQLPDLIWTRRMFRGEIRNRGPAGRKVLATVRLCSSMPGLTDSPSPPPLTVCRGHPWPSPADGLRDHSNMRKDSRFRAFSGSQPDLAGPLISALKPDLFLILLPSSPSKSPLLPLPPALCAWVPRNLAQCFANTMSGSQVLHRSGPWLSLIITHHKEWKKLCARNNWYNACP